jgi:ATP-dependent helicase HrpB
VRLAERYAGLPVAARLADIEAALATRHELVLEAPPGAGKTTLVPLALLDAAWLGSRRILMLEPRRMAARAAAARMAAMLGERAGETVGYRVRLETRVSRATRIEVVTEGVLTRMLQQDPALPGVGLLVFDEYHERSLEADLGLALALAARTLIREADDPLRILAMSATLDGAAVARLLGDAPVLRAEGRAWPVDIHHLGPAPAREALPRTCAAVLRGLLAEPVEATGSILVFLPGQQEIQRVAEALEGCTGAEVLPLHGGLALEEQQRAIAAPAPGTRHLVLATNLAETSLTIEGVATVVDAGLAREPQYDPATGMTRLATRRISRASATQRAGRAGRLGPGRCLRLWSESEQQSLAPQATPEILQADLAPLALALFAFGIDDPRELAWLDPPPAGAWSQALDLLHDCGALERTSAGAWRLTATGERMARMPLHPRLARMLLHGIALGAEDTACALAAILAERAPRREGCDVTPLLECLSGESRAPAAWRGWAQRARRQAEIFEKGDRFIFLSEKNKSVPFFAEKNKSVPFFAGILLACAYPDRIARRRGHASFQLVNGRAATLDAGDALANAEWIVAAELGARAGDASDRVFLAAVLDPAAFARELAFMVETREQADWDEAEGRFVAERRRQVGALVLERERLATLPPGAKRGALCAWLRRRGLERLPWTPELAQWRARVALLHALEPGRWPDVSDAALLAGLEDWLGPALDAVGTQAALARIDLAAALQALLPWPLPRELERLAPARIAVPSGSQHVIDYTVSPPVLAVKLQEMFGCAGTPRIADGRVALQLHLLSPARRPLAVTQDLATFWRNAYPEVRKETRGRYPKHPWPEDPLAAVPTRHTKSRSHPA